MKNQHKLLIGMIIACVVLASNSCGSTGIRTPTAGPIVTGQATNTVIPTATLIPTSSPTRTPTATPARKDTPTPIPANPPTPAPTSVFSQQIQSDGSHLLQDRKNGYEFTLPPDWTILDLASEDLDQVLTAPANLNPAIRQMIGDYKQMLAQGLGMLAIDNDVTHRINNFSPVILSFSSGSVVSPDLPLDFIVEANEQSITQGVKNAQILSSGVSTNKNDVQIGVIEALLPENAPTGNLSIYERLVMFKANSGIITILMFTDQSKQTTLAPIFQDILDSITVTS